MRTTIISLLFGLGVCLAMSAEQSPDSRLVRSETAAGASGFAASSLSNRFLSARFYLPDAQKGYYRGTRFDWSGLISRVDCAGHTFFCEFKEKHDPLNHDDVCGTAEEFGITSPPSYAQARPGEPFIKIGIGVLERTDSSEYKFFERYPIEKPGTWTIERKSNRVTFKQSLQSPGGWAYQFTKIIEASKDKQDLRITRRLKNTGKEPIVTDHYGHNFLRIDNDPGLTNYSLEFPFAPRFTLDSKPQGCVEIKDHSLIFIKQTDPDQAIWVRFEGFQSSADNQIKIVNHRTHATMTIIEDQPLSRLVFYSSGGVLCPEAFIKVNLAPGQAQEWTTTYRFERLIPD